MSFKYFKFIQRVIIDEFNREYGKRIRKKVKGVVLLLANVIKKFIYLKSKQYLIINKIK